MRRVRARLARDDRDGGFSIVELVVAMAVALLLLTLVSRMFVQVVRANADGQSTKTATGIAATAVDEITRVIRQGAQVSTSVSSVEGAVIAGSTPTSITVDTFAGVAVTPGLPAIAPVRVAFSVEASGNLVETRYAGTVSGGYTTFSSTASSTRTVNGPVLTTGTGTDALFVYLDRTGAQVVPGSSGLTATQALTVVAVTVNVAVANPTSTGSDPVRLTNKVTMPNLAILNGGY